jgi:hypothetical protein
LSVCPCPPFLPLDSFSDLYTSHHGWLYNWLWRKLGCRDGAADLAQDTFVRMLATQSADGLREPRAYFLSTVANGLLVNHWRRLTPERTFLAALASRPELTAPSPEERALLVETLYRIDAMLDTLSPRAPGLPAGPARRADVCADRRPAGRVGTHGEKIHGASHAAMHAVHG